MTLYEEDLRDAARSFMNAANLLAAAIESAPEDTDLTFLFEGMTAARIWADYINPPVEDWGGENVVRFPVERLRG